MTQTTALRKFSLRADTKANRELLESIIETLCIDDRFEVSTEVVDHQLQLKVVGRGIPSILSEVDRSSLPLDIEYQAVDVENGMAATYLR